MATLMQKIKDIEDEMARTQKNKATAHHLGLLKAKLAKLRRDLLEPTTKGGGGAGEGFDVTKSGDARVGLVGFPSVGKSTLLNKLTGTFSEVASYEFTTLTCIPGVIVYRGAKIQLLDLPGIIEGAKDGKGRGRQVISTARTCNCIIIVLDAIKPITHKRLIEKELEGFGIRLNKEPPNLTFRKKEKGGINFTSTVTNTHLDLETVKAICSEYRIHNADITLRFDATADDLIDVIEGSRVYMPCIYAVNKIDQITLEELEILDKLPHYCPVSISEALMTIKRLLEKMAQFPKVSDYNQHVQAIIGYIPITPSELNSLQRHLNHDDDGFIGDEYIEDDEYSDQFEEDDEYSDQFEEDVDSDDSDYHEYD